MVKIVAAFALVVMMLVAAAAILRLRGRISSRSRLEDLEREERARNERLTRPDWPTMAREFGGGIPEALEELYSDVALVRRRGIRLGELEIAQFVPAGADSFDPDRWLDVPPGACVIALTLFEDAVFVRTAEAGIGYPVYVRHHDGGDEEMVAPSLSAFVRILRDAVRRDGEQP